MQYKLKNVSAEPFNFEGIVIQPNEVSGELTPEVYQRTLAVYYGTLMPIDDPSYMTASTTEGVVVPNDEEETSEEDVRVEATPTLKTDEVLEGFVCDTCKKEFSTNKALKAHIRFAHKEEV